MKQVTLKIKGRVQGVAYRASARRKALQLGLNGFVKNRPDGSVYAEVEGPEERVNEMIEWCWEGPPLARVEKVQVEEGEPLSYSGFEIRR